MNSSTQDNEVKDFSFDVVTINNEITSIQIYCANCASGHQPSVVIFIVKDRCVKYKIMKSWALLLMWEYLCTYVSFYQQVVP